MTKGTKIALWVGIPLLLIGGGAGYVVYRNRRESIKLISYNPSTKIAKLKVQGKEITFPIQKGIIQTLGWGYSIQPIYGNEQDESTLYKVGLVKNGVTVNSVDLPK